MTEWQPIATAPKDGTRVLVTWVGKGIHRVRIGHFGYAAPHSAARSWQGDGDHAFHNTLIKPTHWMPLPEPPPK